MMRVFGPMPRAMASKVLAFVLAAAGIGVAGGAEAKGPSSLDFPCSARRAAELDLPAPAISTDASLIRVADQTSNAVPTPKVTREQAVAIALRVVQGEVTAVDIEPKRGKLVYAVEILTSDGEETDVLVDIETGEVLGTE